MQPSEIELVFDMDGPIANLNDTMVRLLNERYGENLTVADIKFWDYKKCVKQDLTDQQIYGLFNEPGFWLQHPPEDGAIETLRELINEGFNVSILTACQHGQREKQEWLARYLPELKQRRINFVSEKYRFRSHMFVDDHIGNLKPYVKHNPDSLVLCWDTPYNQEWDKDRVHSWNEIYNRAWELHNFLCTMERHGR